MLNRLFTITALSILLSASFANAGIKGEAECAEISVKQNATTTEDSVKTGRDAASEKAKEEAKEEDSEAGKAATHKGGTEEARE